MLRPGVFPEQPHTHTTTMAPYTHESDTPRQPAFPWLNRRNRNFSHACASIAYPAYPGDPVRARQCFAPHCHAATARSRYRLSVRGGRQRRCWRVNMTQFDRVRDAVGAVHRYYGRIDGLVNNAGRSYAAAVEEIDPALFDEIFHLNVLGPMIAMQAVIPLMRAQGGGSIVNINSGMAFMTVPHYSVYSASKRALLGFSLPARAELEKDRIVVSEIYPFITATNFGKNRMGNPADDGPSSNYADGDKPEFVAGLVLQAIEEGQAQYFANDRLRKMAGGGA